MDYKWLIFLLAGVAHAQLALAFFPSYWDPVRRLGLRFSTFTLLFLIPAMFGFLLAVTLADNWAALSDPIRLLGGLGIGASTATLTLNAVRLRTFEDDKR